MDARIFASKISRRIVKIGSSRRQSVDLQFIDHGCTSTNSVRLSSAEQNVLPLNPEEVPKTTVDGRKVNKHSLNPRKGSSSKRTVYLPEQVIFSDYDCNVLYRS